MTAPVVIENCAIATMDGRADDESGTEHRSGHIVVTGGQITAVGEGPPADVPDVGRTGVFVDPTGAVLGIIQRKQ